MTTEVRRKSILKMCPSDAACDGLEEEGHENEHEKSVKIVDVRKVPPDDVSKWLEHADYVWEYFKVDLYEVQQLDHMPVLSALGCDTAGFSKSKPENDLLKTIDNALKSIDCDDDAKGLNEDQYMDAHDHFKSKQKSKDGPCSLNSVLMRLGSLLAKLGYSLHQESHISTALCQECFCKIVQLTGFLPEVASPSGQGKVSLEVKDNLHFAKPHFYINLPMPVTAQEDTMAKLFATVHVWGDKDPEKIEKSENSEEGEQRGGENLLTPDDAGHVIAARPATPKADDSEAASSMEDSQDTPSSVASASEDFDSDYTDTLEKDSDLAKISKSKFANLRLDESIKSVPDTWICPPNCNLIVDDDVVTSLSHLSVVFGDILCTYKERNVFEWNTDGCETDYRMGFSVRGSKVQVVAMEMMSDVAHQLSSHQMVRHHRIPFFVSPEFDILKREQRNNLLRFLLTLKYTASALNPW